MGDRTPTLVYKLRMWFKATYGLQGMFGARETDLPAEVDVRADTHIRLWMREVKNQGSTTSQLCCDTIIEREPPPRVLEALDGLKNNRLVLDNPPQVDIPYTSLSGTIIDSEGRITPKWRVPLGIMPEKHRLFQRNLSGDLHKTARNFIATLRWRQGASGGYSPLAHVSFKWSNDAATWHVLPSDFTARVDVAQGVDTRSEDLAEVADLLSEEAEPFAHELVREARQLASVAPRSALLIAMSALETGLKHYVAHLVPNAELLLERIPSPPLLTLLYEVIPRIHKSKKIHSAQIPLADEERIYLQKWIAQRNQIAHGTKEKVDTDDLFEFILFITDLLYVLDYHRGHSWALAQLTSRRIRTD